MAHAAPRTRGAIERGSTTDVFSGRAHRAALVAMPVLLGLVYGYWAAANRRHGGPITGWNLLFGFLTALAFAVVLMALLTLAPKLRRELHAVAWAAFSGIAVGFLFSQSGGSVLRSTALSLAVAAGVFATMFYRFYTHEDAEGHRIT
ncbi:hypothetical protein GCM10010297_38230 [Streptomyces malachitofuscus]|nr:hypothetical protein GCM10010297_38230 [Streptomyces malachitofuscus]